MPFFSVTNVLSHLASLIIMLHICIVKNSSHFPYDAYVHHEFVTNASRFNCRRIRKIVLRAGSSFTPSQWETALLCNDISLWLGASLESALVLGHDDLKGHITKLLLLQLTNIWRYLFLDFFIIPGICLAGRLNSLETSDELVCWGGTHCYQS